jgi:hypothetical protein
MWADERRLIKQPRNYPDAKLVEAPEASDPKRTHQASCTYRTAVIAIQASVPDGGPSMARCLIHGDLAARASASRSGRFHSDTGMDLNPYVRFVYDRITLSQLPFTRRFGRVYPLFHHFVDVIGRRPGHHPRQFEVTGREVVQRMCKWDSESSVATHRGVKETQARLKRAISRTSREPPVQADSAIEEGQCI